MVKMKIQNKITFLPVNNGDAIVISINNFNILIDGGFSNTYSTLKKYLNSNQIENINLAILTHSDIYKIVMLFIRRRVDI